MKTTDAPPRFQGIVVSRIEASLGGAGDLSLKVKASFVDKTGGIHGTTERVGAWSEKVLKALSDFVDALESQLLATHFETGEEDDRSAERNTPAGILDARLDRP